MGRRKQKRIFKKLERILGTEYFKFPHDLTLTASNYSDISVRPARANDSGFDLVIGYYDMKDEKEVPKFVIHIAVDPSSRMADATHYSSQEKIRRISPFTGEPDLTLEKDLNGYLDRYLNYLIEESFQAKNGDI